MRKLDYIVRVFVGGTDTVSSIGLADGVCTWATADQTLGILTDNWVSGVSDSVDISVSGNYAKYSSPTVRIIKSKIVEATLNNYNLTLTGSRIEIIETDSATQMFPIELMLFRGVILNPKTTGNIVSLPISHMTNYYSTQLTPAVGDDYSPFVFGSSVKHVKLPVVPAEETTDTIIGDGLTPAFTVAAQSKNHLNILTVYDDGIITSFDMSTFKIKYPIVKITGENSLIGKIVSILSPATSGPTEGHWGFGVTLIPMNAKDSEGVDFFPNGSTLILEGTKYDKIYTPYGSDFVPDNLEVKTDGVFKPFPSYIDSRVDFQDEGRIEILDVDNSGDSFVAPYGVAQWSKTDEVAGLFGHTKVADGVFVSSGVTVGSVEYSDTTNLSDRETPQPANITISGINGGVGDKVYVVYEYPVRLGSNLPEALYSTMENRFEVNAAIGFARFLIVKTISDRYFIDTFVGNAVIGGDIIDEMILPTQVLNDDSNENYRWENSSLSGALGKALEILDSVLNDYEKENVMIVKCAVEYVHTGFVNDEIKQYSKMAPAIPVSYDTDEIYLSSVEGRGSITGTVITDTSTAYESTLQLQNFETMGITTPTTTPAILSSGWGLQYPTESLDNAIDPLINVRSLPLEYQASSVSTKDIKLDMLKYTAGIGHLDDKGRETWHDATNLYSGTGYIFDKNKIDGRPTIVEINPIRIYPEIGVTYANGAISVGNVEQSVYDSSYVTGVSDPDDARNLWFAGNLLYTKYKIKNKYPQKLGDIKGIKNESDAIQYIKNQYKLAGVVIADNIVTLYSRFNASFVVSQEYIWEAISQYDSFTLGTPVRFSYPNIASGVSSLVTSYKPNPLTGKTSITVECTGDSIAVNEETLIIESGTQTNTIVESGTQTDTFKEEI